MNYEAYIESGKRENIVGSIIIDAETKSPCNDKTVAAHLRTFLKECGSFAHTIFPGKRIHLRTKFLQVNVTFGHIRISQVSGMFAFARLYRQAKGIYEKGVRQTDSNQDTAYDNYVNNY